MTTVVQMDQIPSMKTSASQVQKAIKAPSAFDYLSCIICIATLVSSNFWKVQGPLVFLSFIIFSIIFITYCAFYYNVIYKNFILLLFSILGFIYLFLSWFQIIPGKPEFFLQEYVFRMGYFAVAIYPVTAMFYSLFYVINYKSMMHFFCISSIFGCIISVLFLYVFPPYDGHWLVEGSQISFLQSIYSNLNYTITSITILFSWSIFLIFNQKKWVIFLYSIFMVSSASVQMMLFGILAMVLWNLKQPIKIVKPLGLLIVFGFPISALFLVMFAQQIGIDPNTIHRAQWWVEALLAMLSNGGIGLGFGADSTTDFIVEDRFQMLGKWGQLPIHVIHNDFIYTFYSMGFIGGLLIILYHFKFLMPNSLNDRIIDRHLSLFFLIACLTTSVNSAFLSPTIFIGLCFIYGYLQSMTDYYRSAR